MNITVKGMFFLRYVDEAFPHVESKLVAAPAAGRYHAFEPYPLRDYLYFADHIARARFPGATREAYRLLGRGEVEVFASSTLGKVTFSMMRDPSVALRRYPELMSMLVRGPEIGVKAVSPSRVEIAYAPLYGSTEITIGVLEGLAMAFDATPAVDVDFDERRHGTFTVSW